MPRHFFFSALVFLVFFSWIHPRSFLAIAKKKKSSSAKRKKQQKSSSAKRKQQEAVLFQAPEFKKLLSKHYSPKELQTHDWTTQPSIFSKKIPKQLGSFHLVQGEENRTFFWLQVFGLTSPDQIILFHKQSLEILGIHRIAGSGLYPTDSNLLKRKRFGERRKKAKQEMSFVSQTLVKLSRMEQKAERTTQQELKQRKRRCSKFRPWRFRKTCLAYFSFQRHWISKTLWKKSLQSLNKKERNLAQILHRVAEPKTPKHRIYRSLKSKDFGWHSSFRAYLEWGKITEKRYRKDIQKILIDSKLPKELSALPFVESMYNPWIRSKVGAMGLWQLMPNTGKESGLYVPPHSKEQHLSPIDERMDPLFSTQAAIRFVKMCRFYFPTSWPLAITSYNQGPGRMRSMSRKLKSTDLHTIIQKGKGKGFGRDGRNFYAKFYAAMLLMFSDIQKKHKTKPFSIPHAQRSFSNYRILRMNHPIWLTNLRKITKMSLEDLFLYNPALLPLKEEKYYPIPAYFPIRLPKQIYQVVKTHTHKLPKKQIKRMIIQEKTTLLALSKKYKWPVKSLVLLNWKKLSPKKLSSFDCFQLPTKTWKEKRSRRNCEKKKHWFLHKLAKKKLYPKETIHLMARSRIFTTQTLEKIQHRRSSPISWIACKSCTTVWHLRALNPKLQISSFQFQQPLQVPSCTKQKNRKRRTLSFCNQYHYKKGKRARRYKRRRTRRKKTRYRQASFTIRQLKTKDAS